MTKRLSALLRLALVSLSLVSFETGACAEQVITDDRGGDPKTYWDKFQMWRISGESVVIDGACKSACTLVFSVIPRERICVTRNASLAFHAARHAGTMTVYAEATERTFKTYPPDIQKWVLANKALESIEFKSLRGAELEAMVKPCSPNRTSTGPNGFSGKLANQ